MSTDIGLDDAFNHLLILLGILGIAFLFLVIFLDKNKNFTLKRDWREK